MHRWSGKVAIVTGASGGIGEAIARALISHGVKVVGLARRLEKLQQLAAELGKDKLYTLECDVRKESDILKAFAWVEKNLGGVDIMISNAGVITTACIIASETEEYRKIIETNLIAPTIFAREAIRSMQKRGGQGHVININSIAGQFAEAIHIPLGMYAPSKYGLRALGSELRHEIILNNLNVKITNVSPGAVLTDMFRNIANGTQLKNIPILTDKDIADAVIYALGTPPNVEIPEITIIPHNSVIGATQELLENGSTLRLRLISSKPQKVNIAYILQKDGWSYGHSVCAIIRQAMERWSGKVAVVTGASSGIGAAIARCLANHGIKVVGLARRLGRLQELATELGKNNFYPIQCDLTKEPDIVKAFSWVENQLGGVDIIVNNAAIVVATCIIDSETEEHRKAIDLNLIAAMICSREAIKSMRKRAAPGHVININSIAGQFPEFIPSPLGSYGITKCAMRALSVELRQEIIHANLKIKTTNISPGVVFTDMYKAIYEDAGLKNTIVLTEPDVVGVVIYALGTPPNVEIPEITIVPHSSMTGIPQQLLE